MSRADDKPDPRINVHICSATGDGFLWRLELGLRAVLADEREVRPPVTAAGDAPTSSGEVSED